MTIRRVVVACLVLAVAGVLAGVSQAQTISPVCTSAGQTGDCGTGWYTSPVSVVWQATPPPQSTSPWLLGIETPYDSDTNTTLSCAGTWSGKVQSQYSTPLHIEISAPSATATPDRPPDVNGWYNHPLTVTVAGSAFSGIASCTGPQTFSGPPTPGTALGGSCTDNAGKVATASFPFRYDATPPSLTAASRAADGSVNLSWQASAAPAPLQWVQVSRDPEVPGASAAARVLYQGGASSYTDSRVRNGTNYTYTITAVDQAGNVTEQTVTAKPGARLLGPGEGARLSAPRALSWTAIPKATYYNVQLFKGKTKIMSAWPVHPSLTLKRTWHFGGHRRRMTRGTYRWYVWPGFGSRKAAHYGRRIGSASFVIR